MIANVFFDDDNFADIVYIPNNIDLLSAKQDFLDWLFNKEIDHDYWVYVDGKKCYCKYGVDEFVIWLNRCVFNLDSKAKVLERSSREFSMNNPCVYF